jgi:Na+/H+ antiporter NhaA
MLGVVAGKFIGIFLIIMLAIKLKIASLSLDLTRTHILGVSLLEGIGLQ